MIAHMPPEATGPGAEVGSYAVFAVGSAVGTLISGANFCYDGLAGDVAGQNIWGTYMSVCAGVAWAGLEILRHHSLTRDWFNQGSMLPGLE